MQSFSGCVICDLVLPCAVHMFLLPKEHGNTTLDALDILRLRRPTNRLIWYKSLQNDGLRVWYQSGFNFWSIRTSGTLRDEWLRTDRQSINHSGQ